MQIHPTFVVLGATGQTGAAIADLLLREGRVVRAVGRKRARLASLETAGATVLAGDLEDPAFLAGAMRGADAVYALLPAEPAATDFRAAQDRLGEAITAAIRAAGVRRVVALSSVGAEQPDGHGIIAGLHAQEQRLRALDGVDVVALRPGSFFENFYGSLDLVHARGIVADAVAPDIALPMIAVADIAAAAAAALVAPAPRGFTVRELLGPRDLTYAEAARILGERLGLAAPLPYVQLPGADLAAILVEQGASPSFAAQYVAMTDAFNTRRVASPPRTPANTTATRFEDFAATLAAAYAATARS